ncbi:hypothetical protein HN014_06960 [Aquimarina sp. TRL1]|uniref:hypothetical protein n=1 Tax=Aquimarina sp. (strain TRL1) TaxID=2736252 RepID=UPI00158A72F5|nr:hypothetical protein [Aquimarina sp. TRL1]QKX04662.1 hypothetical protein HN014_06960 [Aquimarina sp. TRL1]
MHYKKLLLLLMFSFLLACKNDHKKDKNTINNETITAEKTTYKEQIDNTCIADSTWFQTTGGIRKTPPPNEGPTSVFADNSTVTNCDFHQWSWQKFLWLTNETNGVPFFQDHLLQITSHGEILDQRQGIILTDIAQASSKTDILKTNKMVNANKKTDTVYYSIHVNKLLFETMKTYAPIAKEDPLKVNGISFPVGALELKISWVAAAALADTSTYYITDGIINGEKTKIALLGMHVVGIVENHPEFIWATFEHDKLAPKYDWDKATPTSDAPVTSTSNYLFFNKDSTATVKNITSGNGIYENVFSVYKFGVPVKKEMKGSFNVQVYMETSQKGSENFTNIHSINEHVKNQLTDIWKNYFYNGSIWINTEGFETTEQQTALLDSLGGNLSQSRKGDLTRGSVSAYNITMETYVQVGFSPTSIHSQTVDNLVNCFSCHNTSGNNNNRSPLYISHLFTGYLKNLQGYTKEEIKEAHVNEIIAQFKRRERQNN